MHISSLWQATTATQIQTGNNIYQMLNLIKHAYHLVLHYLHFVVLLLFKKALIFFERPIRKFLWQAEDMSWNRRAVGIWYEVHSTGSRTSTGSYAYKCITSYSTHCLAAHICMCLFNIHNSIIQQTVDKNLKLDSKM
jgi:hypothetical protein